MTSYQVVESVETYEYDDYYDTRADSRYSDSSIGIIAGIVLIICGIALAIFSIVDLDLGVYNQSKLASTSMIWTENPIWPTYGKGEYWSLISILYISKFNYSISLSFSYQVFGLVCWWVFIISFNYFNSVKFKINWFCCFCCKKLIGAGILGIFAHCENTLTAVSIFLMIHSFFVSTLESHFCFMFHFFYIKDKSIWRHLSHHGRANVLFDYYDNKRDSICCRAKQVAIAHIWPIQHVHDEFGDGRIRLVGVSGPSSGRPLDHRLHRLLPRC